MQDGVMVGDFIIICLLAFFNIFIYLLFFIYLKIEGSRKGSRRGSKIKGSKRGVQKGGSTFCLHPFRTIEARVG